MEQVGKLPDFQALLRSQVPCAEDTEYKEVFGILFPPASKTLWHTPKQEVNPG
jgi:hypothetical protein